MENKKIGWKKDWPALIYLLIASIGFIVSLFDFWKIQNLNFQIGIPMIIGIILLIIGGILRLLSRKTLTKAGFNIVNSYKLQIIDKQRLITNGVYKHIRHPLYFGELSRNFGFALLFSSLYGLIIMIIASLFLIARIQIEERLLITKFGNEYKEYMQKTKKLIPYLF
jgi:protein-S-isoprenylcysteine O-methyltransferase Ste14